jgi:hypothetical protein
MTLKPPAAQPRTPDLLRAVRLGRAPSARLASFLNERYARGLLYGEMRSAWLGGRRETLLLYLLASAIPIRLVQILALVAGHSAQAGKLRDYVLRCL